MSSLSVFQKRMLEEPTNRKPQGVGRCWRSAAAKAAISGANRSGPYAVAAGAGAAGGWAKAGAASATRQRRARAVARMGAPTSVALD
jgi:hypothetical protein